MLSSVRLLSHGRGVRQHPQPQKISQTPFVPFLPFSNIPRPSLFCALQEGKIFGQRSASLASKRANRVILASTVACVTLLKWHAYRKAYRKAYRILFSKDDLVISMGQVCGDSGSPPTHQKPRKSTKHPQSAHKANKPNLRLPYTALPYCPIALLLPHARQGDGGLIDILATWPVSRNRLSWLFTRCCLRARSTKR